MILGRGDIASVLTDRLDRLYFASGVSNSAETREGEYAREAGLLLEQDPAAHVVYFSSLSIFYAQGRYQQHKRQMETMVKRHFQRWTILRLGNIDWGTNPHTLINHLRAQAAAGLPLDVQDVYRYVLTVDEFWHWLALIPDWSCEINITGQRMKVHDIVLDYVPYMFWNGHEFYYSPVDFAVT